MNQDQWSMVSSLFENETGKASVRWLADVGLDVEVRRAAHNISVANIWEKSWTLGE
jgi:hypothetical protein